MTHTRVIFCVLCVLSLVVTGHAQLAAPSAVGLSTGAPPPPPPTGSHGYFNALVAHSAFWKGYSFRPVVGQPISSPYYEHQLKHPSAGGYANSNSAPLAVTYNPTMDTDPNRQDAAKIVIPAWRGGGSLAAPMLASTSGAIETITFNSAVGSGSNQGLRIGTEIVKVNGLQPQSTTRSVIRGQFGTTASAHSAGAAVEFSMNSLANQLRVPLNTIDGHVYLFTWDVLWTSSYVRTGLTNHKSLQFGEGIGDRIWFETQTRFSGAYSTGFNPLTDVASITTRSYIPPGDPILPKIGQFIIKPNVWTRFWARIDMRASNPDLADVWVADETHAAVQLYSQSPITGSLINRFWIEFNTSTDNYTRGDSRNLVAYVRNFVALRDVANIQLLLIKP